jgi:murein L,D-transpeptidase YcbB/YkuD
MVRLRVFLIGVAAFVWVSALGLLDCLAAPSLSKEVRENLRTRIETAGTPPRIAVGEEGIHASVVLPRFYEHRMYEPAWSDDDGPIVQADSLIQAIQGADREGLRPSDYHLAEIEGVLAEVIRNKGRGVPLYPPRLADLDVLLTDAFLIYGAHLLAGRVNPETFDSEWHANRRQGDLAAVLQAALDSNRIEEALKGLLPPQPGYLRLREALARYRNVAAKAGWPIVPDGPKLQKGDQGERVLALRTRLVSSGDLEGESGVSGGLFDNALEQALRKFQQRHGLDVDGMVGPATLAALNVPVETRLRQIELNMERWRWLPQDLGQRYILINIANFELDVVESGQPVMMMRVVVGRGYRRTPVFSDKMTYLVLSPYWHVPKNIAVQDKLPLIKKDPNYLAEQHMKVFQGWGAEAKEIDPKTVDWSRVNAKNFPLRLRQDPGPWNALGRVKFMFPNTFNVYLHDTPSQELFAKTTRTFSSGCIRIEKPMELTAYVLRGDPDWNRERILAVIATNVEQTVRLPEPMPVYLLYWTAWAHEDGSIQFRTDIYGRDRLLDQALAQEAPIP